MQRGAPPSGTIAFLFSDIEGSTRRWDAYGAAMRDALRRHDQILRSEIERNGGYVFKTIGDAFCAAFAHTDAALDAALAVQRRLEAEDFSAVDGLPVRVTISAGDAEARDGDYFGTPVNRASRLLGAAHGGQILVAGAAADALTNNLPGGVVLRQLGVLALRDLREPERVFQPIVEDLRSEFRPLRAIETPPNNLPRRHTSFVGRGRDVIAIVRSLESEALLTIVGAGGMGKTRLALEVAAATLNDRADGAWFVDLATLSDESLVPNAVAAALGVELAQNAAPLDALTAHLATRELLLVLDNCEHVIGAAATLVATLLARCPHLTVLATSRAPLDVGGEYVYRLATLDRESAIRLFNERARAADRSYDPKPYPDALDEIVRRLDGIALAIELAAARVRTMPLPALARHLELRLLAGGRDRLARQQTMQALIDWSYDLLSDEERRVLRHCAICTGGFNLREGVRIAGIESRGEVEILDGLSSLVDKSLAIVEGRGEEPRYRLLEPIREYALARLDEASEREAARRRHARAYAHFGAESFTQWDTDPPADWLARNERELGNFRAALNFADAGDSSLFVGLAGDTAPVFLRLALLSEGIAWCERALGRDAPAGAITRLHYGLSMLYNNSGASRRAFEEALEAVRLARGDGDARSLARALSQLAHRYSARKRFEEANAVAQEALDIARAVGDRRLLADVLRRCAPAFLNLGMARVRETYAQSVELFRALGRNDETARALMWSGQSEVAAGEYATAARLLIEAQALVSSDEDGLAGEIAACYLAMGEPASARPYAVEAFDAARRVRNSTLLAFALSNLAVLDAGSSPEAAARLIGYADERLRAAGWKRVAYDAALVQSLKDALSARLGDALAPLLAEGAAANENTILALAVSLLPREPAT